MINLLIENGFYKTIFLILNFQGVQLKWRKVLPIRPLKSCDKKSLWDKIFQNINYKDFVNKGKLMGNQRISEKEVTSEFILGNK